LDFGLGLVIGLVIGLLINWVLEPLFKRRAHSAAQVNAELQPRSEALESASAGEGWRAGQASTPGKITKVIIRDRDDLERIDGIGPVFASRLNEGGIFTYKQLTSTPAARIQQLVAAEAWQNIDVQAWIVEAERLAAQQHN